MTAEYQDIIWNYQFSLWSIVNVVLGMSSVCFLIEKDNGISNVIAALAYPLYVLSLIFIWSKIGDYLEDSVVVVQFD